MISRLKNYLLESWQEVKKVNWPTRKEVTKLTLIVLGFSVALAIFLGVLDIIFSYGLEQLIFNLHF
ncbi:MAG: hypothetical protein KatS3mg098_479 [Candidatus Parcubacteria bacterium]|nr:preprotein translocase subunit SecE [Patescibacteria group bacterium]BCX16250.1 MAG: hypothetical protein KatS3mg098_479 [Candidatus Parcubacteria bacterium]